MAGRPFFFWWYCGPSSPNVLANLKFPQPRDHPRTERQRERERRKARHARAEGGVLKHTQRRIEMK